MTFKDSVDALIEITRTGPYREWVDRMGIIAGDAGCRSELIDWCGSPMSVACAVVSHAAQRGISEKLEQEIIRRKMKKDLSS